MGQRRTKLQMGLIKLHTKLQSEHVCSSKLTNSNIQPEEIQNSDQDSDS